LPRNGVYATTVPWRHDPEGAAIGKLEYLTAGALVTGIVPGDEVTVVAVSWHGQEAVTLTYQETSGQVSQRLLFRADEPSIGLGGARRRWSFDGDGAAFRLAAAARRIRLAAWQPVTSARSPRAAWRCGTRSAARRRASLATGLAVKAERQRRTGGPGPGPLAVEPARQWLGPDDWEAPVVEGDRLRQDLGAEPVAHAASWVDVEKAVAHLISGSGKTEGAPPLQCPHRCSSSSSANARSVERIKLTTPSGCRHAPRPAT